jgi:hypothetical protein
LYLKEASLAITKKEVEEKYIQEISNAVSAIENIIDKKLSEKYSGRSIIVCLKDLNIPDLPDSDYYNRFVNEVMKRYTKQGWDVTFKTDQNEGSSLVFL